MRPAASPGAIGVTPGRFVRFLRRPSGERLSRTPEEFKVWSQNLGHEKVLTTFSSYGEVAPDRQAEITRDLARPEVEPAIGASLLAKALMREIQEYGIIVQVGGTRPEVLSGKVS